MDWEKRCGELEAEVNRMSSELLDSEQSLLSALVAERKLVNTLREQLQRTEDRYEMAKQAMESVSTKTLGLEQRVEELEMDVCTKRLQIEGLEEQRQVDSHVKKDLYGEIQSTRLKLKQLSQVNQMLTLKLDISEGGGGGGNNSV
ncbi:hypothetical protein BASA81_001945 [Batrachochytrium salamandrivorans]|nr:hypothetical protein BASA81_001945 [Batrachochytrium salamandrivorans]